MSELNLLTLNIVTAPAAQKPTQLSSYVQLLSLDLYLVTFSYKMRKQYLSRQQKIQLLLFLLIYPEKGNEKS